jgi:glutathione synthase/RimK-type ligase-like ATP-grasp enzyme
VLKLEGSRFRPRPGDLVINWGSTNCWLADAENTANAVAEASDKLAAFAVMQAADVSVPAFWTSPEDIPEDVRWPVVCRTVLNGHSGRGIVIANNRDELVDAPLYVEYVPKQDEYRVHVVRGEVICIQQKRRIHEHPNPNWQVRNHSNGFVFARCDVVCPDSVTSNAVAAVVALGLDFGAVDVVYNNRRDRAYVLEVNTAPGLEGATVGDYAAAFTRIARDAARAD